MTGLPLVGDEFAGYRTRSVLGRGGMSVVYQAENLRLGNVIALKVLAPELAANDVFRARFLGVEPTVTVAGNVVDIEYHGVAGGNGAGSPRTSH